MAGKDFYAILGVGRNASVTEIKKAYRRLAQKYHPDKNPGNKRAEERFKEISVANDVLVDPRKRALYDEFGMEGLQPGFDAERMRAFRRGASRQSGRQGPFREYSAGYRSGGGAFSDILNELFSGLGRQARGVPGADIEYPLEIDLLDAIRGKSVVITLERPAQCTACHGKGRSASGRCARCNGAGTSSERGRITVKIPPGVDTGSKVRVAGKGGSGQYGAPPGDLYLVIKVREHQFLERKGNDLYLNVPITVGEAVHGATVTVPRPGGKIKIKVPPGSQSGRMLRLRNLGARDPRTHESGDLFVRLLVHVPTNGGERVQKAIDTLERSYANDPRHGLQL